MTENPFVRNRYFYGKLLTVSDFETEQRYFLEKARAVNYLLHGIGVVSGLQVNAAIISTTGGNALAVKIAPGMALDCCGNLIYVSDEQAVQEDQVENKTYYIYLRYKQCYEHPQPAPHYPCKEECCYGHILDAFEIIVSTGEPEVKSPELSEVPAVNLEKSLQQETQASCSYCNSPQESRVLIGVVKIAGGEIDSEGSIAEFIKYRSVVYNLPVLRELVLSLNDFALKAGAHLTDFNNPHKTDHNATNPIPADETSDDNTRDKHLSNADALRWNRSIAAIQVDNVLLEKPGGYIKLKAGDNIALKTEGNDTIIISAEVDSTPTARTGMVTIKTGEDGLGSAIVNPGLKVPYSVQLGLEFETETGVYVEYAPVYHLKPKEQVSLSNRVFLKGELADKFEITVHHLNSEITNVRVDFQASVHWVAIPAKRVRRLPPIVRPT